MKVLVVEDERITGLLVKMALKDAGHEVIGPYRSVPDAIEAADRSCPDLALVDINLGSGGDGRDLAKELTSRRHIPCLFVTAHCSEARKAQDSAVGCVGKPYTAHTLVDSVGTVETILNGEHPSRIPYGLQLFASPTPAEAVPAQ